MEPFSTSVFKDLFWIFATSTKICTNEHSIMIHIITFSYSSRLPTQSIPFIDWIWLGYSLKRHPFSGLLHSAGELLHTPLRIPTSMATVLLSRWTNTFFHLTERIIRRRTISFGWSRIASPAYPEWPTCNIYSNPWITQTSIASYPFKVWE